MKEMLGNLADGEIEFYKAVSAISSISTFSRSHIRLGDGRMGEDYTNYSTDSCGRLIDYFQISGTVLHLYPY